MGLPIKHRKTYVSHKKRWDKSTILEEAKVVEDYALKNKKEIRKIEFMLSKFKTIAKSFNSLDNANESEDAKRFIASLKAKGFLAQESNSLDDVLNITIRDILDRRLSNIVYKLKLARSPKQARQFVVHRHVRVDGKVIDSPSALISLAGEAAIEFRESSSLFDEEHPERKLAEDGLIEEVTKEIEVKDNQILDEDGKSPSDLKEESLDEEEQDEVKSN
ncbi:MAG: 30S ribosomal protein S4 [Nanoarchaeota archaeon]|nr:30S ribosomal protein S4 [Nanoarchaeota archaeon]MEC8339125.1 30S ribosomal protein S4 [Nanoarchaeota archaeon]